MLRVWYIECSCKSPDHSIRFMSNPEDKEIYIETQLQSYKLFKRIVAALKYIFGVKSSFGLAGHWEETILDEAQSFKLYNFLKDHFRKTRNNK